MQIDGLYAVNPDTGADNRIPDSWFQQGVRPYFASWINGGTAADVYSSVYSGRQGHMPHWRSRMTPAQIKLLALYVDQLGEPQ